MLLLNKLRANSKFLTEGIRLRSCKTLS